MKNHASKWSNFADGPFQNLVQNLKTDKLCWKNVQPGFFTDFKDISSWLSFFLKLFLVLIIILFLHRTVQRDTRKMFDPVNLRHQKCFLSSWTALITHRSHKLASALVTAVMQITICFPVFCSLTAICNIAHVVRDLLQHFKPYPVWALENTLTRMADFHEGRNKELTYAAFCTVPMIMCGCSFKMYCYPELFCFSHSELPLRKAK